MRDLLRGDLLRDDLPRDELPRVPDLLRVEELCMDFSSGSGWRKGNTKLRAVDRVSFGIARGEVLGLVGESGSGKSTVARLITGIYRPVQGSVHFGGVNLTAIRSRRRLNRHRQQMQMIFQDPFSSLNGRMRVLDIVAEPICFHRLSHSAHETRRIVLDLLAQVGLPPAAARKFPHEFSGGQRQRISIARALATRPQLLICDEPTSALDVSIQAQILNLLKDLQETLKLTMLFISHDLPVVRQMCDRVAVMRQGRLLEMSETQSLFEASQHAYTKHLLALMPKLSLLAAPETRSA